MYLKLEDFLTDWKYESESTLKLFRNISNEALNKKDHDNVRTIAVLVWHITITIREMMGKAGLEISGPEENSNVPSNIKEMITVYENSSKSLFDEVKNLWKDEVLLEELNMYGENWKKGTTLSILIKHQAHHRGQLTILMRQAGLKVTGIYGPIKEDWAEWNMPAKE